LKDSPKKSLEEFRVTIGVLYSLCSRRSEGDGGSSLCSCFVGTVLSSDSARNAFNNDRLISNSNVYCDDEVEWRSVTRRSNCGQFSMALRILAVKGSMPFILRGVSTLSLHRTRAAFLLATNCRRSRVAVRQLYFLSPLAQFLEHMRQAAIREDVRAGKLSGISACACYSQRVSVQYPTVP